MPGRYFSRLFLVALFLGHAGPAQAEKVKGMRFDPSYLYGLASNATAGASLVVSDARSAGVNTIFIRAYSSVYGAFYPTTYANTIVESGFGVEDMLGNLITAAHANGIQVVAWLPVNDFQQAWTANPAWRSKKKNGADYVPASGLHLMSCSHPGFIAWYKGFLDDLMARYPAIDGIEAGEGFIDYNWNYAADYNPVSNAQYAALYPSGKLGDANWRIFRAQGLTALHQLLATEAHARGKLAFVVQTWDAASNGNLMAASSIMDGSGFDFNGIMNLKAPGRPDYMIAEVMFQQWRDTYSNATLFTPEWTQTAVAQFVSNVAGRVIAEAHVELSDFGGGMPTASQFHQALLDAYAGAPGGADFYDWYLARTNGVFSYVAQAFAGF